MPQTWLIVGASSGFGLELVSCLLTRGDRVIATARAPSTTHLYLEPENASKLWSLTGGLNGSNLTILECDVDNENRIQAFRDQIRMLGRAGRVLEHGVIDFVVFNPSISNFPKRNSEITFSAFNHFLHRIAIGPLTVAQQLLRLSSLPLHETLISLKGFVSSIKIRTLVFISSDFWVTIKSQEFGHGNGAFAASMAALNQGLRHMAAELQRKASVEGTKSPAILAIHPGNLNDLRKDTANLFWQVESRIKLRELTKSLIKIIKEKGHGGMDEGGWLTAEKEGGRVESGEASFWTWDGKRYVE
ncbi:CsgA protein [Golovinomyces cichoracearum]|uniref:CsgA protein n=1 Tax=Golovinomyces cichoracearum TaxID=62708 RepID=A0A420HQI0_9PEZI|nr:CsgA protein [Golovinomyces cichoracearum]